MLNKVISVNYFVGLWICFFLCVINTIIHPEIISIKANNLKFVLSPVLGKFSL